jgi:hypothetical protein
MAKVPINDPKHWRERAEEARAVADAMADEKTKKMMLRMRRKAAIVPRANEQSNLRYSNVNNAVGAELYLLAQLLFFGRGLIGRCN